jgi:hypothetical protein
MYFAVLRVETKFGKPGAVYAVAKEFSQARNQDVVRATKVTYSNTGNPDWNFLTAETISQKVARECFTRPTQDFDAALEESFMVCEGAYC